MTETAGGLELEILVRGDVDGPEAELRVIGEFDRLHVARFDQAGAALSQAHVRLTVDLRQTTIIDSAALGSLVRLRNSLEHIDGELRVVVSKPFQITVMKVGGLYDFLNVGVLDEPAPPSTAPNTG